MIQLRTILALVVLSLSGLAQVQPRNDLRMLLVAQDPENPQVPIQSVATERTYELCRERKAAFEGLLRAYFTNVTVVNSADYTVALSEAADVTLFDALPPVLVPGERGRDPETGAMLWRPDGFLPADFSHAALTISHVSPRLGESLGTKHDWL